MKFTLLPILILSFISCKKEKAASMEEEMVTVPYSEASYQLVFTLNWQSPQFAVPPNVHVTTLAGMVHSKDTTLWSPGSQATKGIEDVAEIGNTVAINVELDAIVSKGKALSKFLIPPPVVTGSTETILDFNTDFSAFSFASMIAPSPDWFMGVHDYDLFKNNKWVADTTIAILLYDAGTEDGDVFNLNNPATNPQQPISFLTPQNAMVLANGNNTIDAIGTIHFRKIK